MWEFVLTDLAGNSIGDLAYAAYDRKVTLPLNGIPSFSFRVRLDHPHADLFLNTDLTLVKVYDGKPFEGGVLRLVGPVVSSEEVGQAGGGSIACTAYGVGWRLAHRLIGKSLAGFSQASAIDLGTIAKNIIDAVNADAYTGVTVGSVTTGVANMVGPWWYKPVLEAIQEMSGTLDGYDWKIAPSEPTAVAGGIQLGVFSCAAFFGGVKANAIFEFGTGKRNVRTYQRVVNADSLLNVGYNLPPGFPDNATQAVQTSSDTPSLAEHGRHEGIVSSDLVVDAMRLQLLQEHVRIRKQPRQTITFQPTRDGFPVFGSDYDLGDIVPFRAVANNVVRVNANFRVYAIEWSIDSQGNAQPAVTVSPNS